MKARINRGTGFRGLLNYVFEGQKNDPQHDAAAKAALVVGGNMAGESARELAAEFAEVRKLRTDIGRPVWHCSLALPPGERIDAQRWAQITGDFMQTMGFRQDCPFVVVRHHDTEHDHVHIVASRIGLDGRVWLGQRDVHQAIAATQELERRHGLTLTPGLEVRHDRTQPKKGEIELGLRTEEKPPRLVLQEAIDGALAGRPSVQQFVERLEAAGVHPVPNVASTGRMNGFSFELNGVAFKASQLGDRYKWGALAQELDHDQARDAAFLTRVRDAARDRADAGRAAEAAGGPAAPEADRRGPEAAPERAGERQEPAPGRAGLEARALGPGDGRPDGRDALDAGDVAGRGLDAAAADGRELAGDGRDLERGPRRDEGRAAAARGGVPESREGSEEPAGLELAGVGPGDPGRGPGRGAYGRLLDLFAPARAATLDAGRGEAGRAAQALSVAGKALEGQPEQEAVKRIQERRELLDKAQEMPLDQLGQEVRQAYPAKVADLVAQDLDVKRLAQARRALEQRDGELRQEEGQALAKAHFLRQGIEKFEEMGWFGRWWHRKEMAKLQAELAQRKAEAKVLAKARKALAKEHKATVKLEQQARAKALPGAELEVQRQRERHTALEVVYQRRLERERPQQQHDRAQERGKGLSR